MDETFWLEITGQEPEDYDDYDNALAALDDWADDYEKDGYLVEYGLASQDNLAAVRATDQNGHEHLAQIVRSYNDGS